MEKEELLSKQETSRVQALLHTCFRDVDDFDNNVTWKCVVQADNKSFWSKIIRVYMDWKDEKLAETHPKSIFMKVCAFLNILKKGSNMTERKYLFYVKVLPSEYIADFISTIAILRGYFGETKGHR